MSSCFQVFRPFYQISTVPFFEKQSPNKNIPIGSTLWCNFHSRHAWIFLVLVLVFCSWTSWLIHDSQGYPVWSWAESTCTSSQCGDVTQSAAEGNVSENFGEVGFPKLSRSVLVTQNGFAWCKASTSGGLAKPQHPDLACYTRRPKTNWAVKRLYIFLFKRKSAGLKGQFFWMGPGCVWCKMTMNIDSNGGIHFWFLILANGANMFFLPLKTPVFSPKNCTLTGAVTVETVFGSTVYSSDFKAKNGSDALQLPKRCFAVHSILHQHILVKLKKKADTLPARWGQFRLVLFFFKRNPLKFTSLIWVSTLGSFFHCFLVQMPQKKPNGWGKFSW